MKRLDCLQLHWWDYAIPGMVDAALALTGATHAAMTVARTVACTLVALLPLRARFKLGQYKVASVLLQK